MELLESMNPTSFIWALTWFFSTQGQASLLRSNQGTNFMGAETELDESLNKMDPQTITKYLSDQGCTWQFNLSHASHFSGVWEWQISMIRCILDTTLLEMKGQKSTHKLLVTLMPEVSTIIDTRPITTIPLDCDEPLPKIPSMLLTQPARPSPKKICVSTSICTTEVKEGTVPGRPVLVKVDKRILTEPAS